MASHKVLITGATGYMGGTILSTILKSPLSSLRITEVSVLVRRESQSEAFHAVGVKTITFKDLDDVDFLTTAAKSFDVVIHSANGFHVESAKALIKGLGARKSKTGQAVHYIQNSGTSNVGDQAISGKYTEPSPRVFSDRDDIYTYEKGREAKQPYPQRTLDVTVVEEGLALGVSTYILSSPLIYGLGTGFFNKTSIQIPLLIGSAIASGESTFIGTGSGIWNHTHIEDAAELYTLLLGKILAGEKLPSGKEGYYFLDSGVHSWIDVARRISDAGVKLGQLKNPEPKSITLVEAAKKWANGYEQIVELGFSSRAVTSGDKSRELGWTPQKTDEDWDKTFIDEFQRSLSVRGNEAAKLDAFKPPN